MPRHDLRHSRPAGTADLPAAARVWQEANTARGKVPDQARIARIHAKLADPEALVIVTVEHDEVVGMALAEPGRQQDGSGRLDPELCHISMVFVRPDRWGRRIGADLLDTLATHAARSGYARVQLWTGCDNTRALRLYQRAGFHLTGRRLQLHTGEPILQLTRCVSVLDR